MSGPFTFICCFCGGVLPEEEAHPLVFVYSEQWDDVQQWWTHDPCFRSALHETARDFKDEAA